MKQSIDNILSALKFEEKCRLLTGSAALSSAAIERLCVPSLNMSDGPHGVRRLIGHPTCPQECHIEGGDTCFPTASAVGSSWNRKKPNLEKVLLTPENVIVISDISALGKQDEVQEVYQQIVFFVLGHTDKIESGNDVRTHEG